MQFTIGMIGQSLYPGSQKLWWEDIGSDEIVRMVQRADELGFDMVRIGEHVVMHEDWVDVMGPRWVDSALAARAYSSSARAAGPGWPDRPSPRSPITASRRAM